LRLFGLNGRAKALIAALALAVIVVAGLAIFATSYQFKQQSVSSTVPAVQSGCFNIPANPTRQQVVSFISMAYNGSSCAIAAIRVYNSSGVIARYNLTVNMTKLSSLSSNGIYS
jgi:hypothetical protein